jgi:hypothetical protein
MHDRRELSKVVKVSDPECWYGRDEVTVRLFVYELFKGKFNVRLFVESIDDFAMEYTRECYSSASVDYTYKLMKENMFDTMPKEISYKWLLEHGYFPF